MILTQSEKKTNDLLIRQFVYFCITIGFIFFIHVLTKIYPGYAFVEFGIIENVQLILLFLSGSILALYACFLSVERPLFWALSSLCFFAVCRELDSFFDKALPIISWKFGFLFPLAAGIYAIRHWQDARKMFFDFVKTPAFNLMLMALLICVPVAQVLGHRPFIAAALGTETDARAVRRLIEEGLEVIGYFLIFLSTIECYFSVIRKKINYSLGLKNSR